MKKCRNNLFYFYKTFRKKMPSPRLKTPLLEHTVSAFRLGSHHVNIHVSSRIVLTMLHFVWTDNFFSKINKAVMLKSHYARVKKYRKYRILLDEILANGGSLLSAESREFVLADNFKGDDSMIWYTPYNDGSDSADSI